MAIKNVATVVTAYNAPGKKTTIFTYGAAVVVYLKESVCKCHQVTSSPAFLYSSDSRVEMGLVAPLSSP